MRRRGFTLLEVVVSTSILSIVLVGVVSAFVGMRKGQGVAVTTNLLKVGGQKAMHDMYVELSQARRLLSGPKGTSPEPGSSYFALLQLASGTAVPATIPANMQKFPIEEPTGGFGSVGNSTGQLVQSSIGNMIVFLKQDTPYTIDVAGLNESVGSGGATTSLSSHPINLTRYRFVAYFLAQQPLPNGKQIAGLSYTWQLIHWVSQPYFEKNEYMQVAGRLDIAGNTAGTVNTLFNTTLPAQAAGIWDSSATSALTAFYQFPTLAAPAAPPAMTQVASPTIARDSEALAFDPSLNTYATTMLAFNSDQLSVPGLTVPEYGCQCALPGAPAIVDEAPIYDAAVSGGEWGRLVMSPDTTGTGMPPVESAGLASFPSDLIAGVGWQKPVERPFRIAGCPPPPPPPPPPSPGASPTPPPSVETPFGFEVGIDGPSGAREVLVRLSFAAQLNSSPQTWIGMGAQEIVSVMDL